jgi:hypothetical protein
MLNCGVVYMHILFYFIYFIKLDTGNIQHPIHSYT